MTHAATCAHCGTPFVPTHAQRKSHARGLQLFCTEAHRTAFHNAERYDPDGLYADWEGQQLWCCQQFHPITTVPLTVPCCGRTWLESPPGTGAAAP